MKNLSPQHHPDTNLLIEFAAGSIDYGQSIAISAHLHYCTQCQAEIMKLERIGGAMMAAHERKNDDHAIPSTLDFDALMDKIQHVEPTPVPTSDKCNEKQHQELPKAVRKMLLPTTRWKRITSSLRSAGLVAGQNKYAVSLQKIHAGGKAPRHDHRGTEMTVVLKGSFSDEDGVYQQGDFLLKNEGDIHCPMASKNEDCLCLSVEQAPVKLTSLLGRILVNPFLRINAL